LALGDLVTSAAGVLQVPADIPNEQLAACLSVLLLLRKHPAADGEAFLTEAVQGGFVLHHMESARSAPDFRATALCVLAQLQDSPEGEIRTAVGNAAQGQQWYRTFAENLDSTGEGVIGFLAEAVREFWDGSEMLFTGRDSSIAGSIVARIVDSCLRTMSWRHSFPPTP